MEVTEKRHYAVVDNLNRKLIVRFKGEIIAESSEALILKEVGKSVYDPVYYIPKKDLSIELLPETERSSYCPIKGDASYWNLSEKTEEYFAWSYENPIPKSKKIKGHIAFNPAYVSFQTDPF